MNLPQTDKPENLKLNSKGEIRNKKNEDEEALVDYDDPPVKPFLLRFGKKERSLFKDNYREEESDSQQNLIPKVDREMVASSNNVISNHIEDGLGKLGARKQEKKFHLRRKMKAYSKLHSVLLSHQNI